METTIVGAQGSLLGPKQGKVGFLLEAYEKKEITVAVGWVPRA